MKQLLLYLLEMTIASGIFYGYYHLMLRNKRFHQYNRFYILGAVAISILIPFLKIPVYFTQSERSVVFQTLQTISFPTMTAESTSQLAPVQATQGGFDWNIVLYSLYSLIILLVLVRMLFSLKRIRAIIRTNPVEELNGVHFVNTEEPGTPYSFFRWLFWNKKIELDSSRGEQIFRHEIFHIQQRHSVDIVGIELLTALFWVNPFFHLMKKELKAIHEFLADHFAARETEKWQYAELLLMQSLNTRQELVNPFFHNQIKRRIAMITHPQKTSHRYLRKLLVLPMAAMIVTLFAFKYKEKTSDNRPIKNTSMETLKIHDYDTVPPAKAKTVINPKKQNLVPDTVDVIVWKTVDDKLIADTAGRNPLVVLDGKILGNIKLLGQLDMQVTADDIESINVYKGNDAIRMYGEKGRYGVIEITTKKKKNAGGKGLASVSPDDNRVFEQMEIEPSFPGGEMAWKKYLERNLDVSVPTKNKAPNGVYTVYMEFIVHTDGLISDIRALTNHGFGMEQEAIRVIKGTPKWIPGIQNGRTINGYRKMPVIFVVGDIKQVTIHLQGITLVAYNPSGGKNPTPSSAKITVDGTLEIGSKEWRKFFERNLDVNMPIREGWAEGDYQIFLQFTCNEDGSISQIEALNSPNSKTAKQCVDLMKSISRVSVSALGVSGKKHAFVQPFTFSILSENAKAIGFQNIVPGKLPD